VQYEGGPLGAWHPHDEADNVHDKLVGTFIDVQMGDEADGREKREKRKDRVVEIYKMYEVLHTSFYLRIHNVREKKKERKYENLNILYIYYSRTKTKTLSEHL